MRYCPVPSVMTVRAFSMSAALDASTETPGSTAADASRTTPAIVAWANTRLGSSRRPASAADTFPIRSMVEPSLDFVRIPKNRLTCGRLSRIKVPGRLFDRRVGDD